MSSQANTSKLQELENHCKTLFDGLNFCIAGGAVRDTLVGKAPKDYDVFVFTTKEILEQRLKDAGIDLDEREDRNPDYSLADSIVCGVEVQFMVRPETSTVDELLRSFDWAICKHAWCDGRLVDASWRSDVPEAGKELTLSTYDTPEHSLVRGVEFASKFDMLLSSETVRLLVSLIQAKAVKEYIDAADVKEAKRTAVADLSDCYAVA